MSAPALDTRSIDFPEKMQFLFQPAKFKVAYGGRAGLKSWSFARALLILGLSGKERILCARELQKSIDESVHKLLADQISLMGMNYLYDVQQAHILGRGSAEGTSFSFEGLRHNVTKIKSYEGITRCWVEEAAKFSKNSFNVLEPTIFRVPNSEIWLSFNPEQDEDFVYIHFVLHRPPPGAIVVKTTWRDNQWLTPEILESIRHLRETDYDEYLHVYEGHTKQVLEGAIFADELRSAVAENRITSVAYERGVPVSVAFDLGYADMTCMWFWQKVGFNLHVINYYQNRLKHIDHYLEKMQSMGYLYTGVWLPHDAKMKTPGTRMSIEEQVRALYPRITHIVPKLSVQDRINAGRTIFPKCYFDAERTIEGIKGLRGYRYELRDGKFSRNPDHEGSDCADAFTYMGIASAQRTGAIDCKLDLPRSVTERGLRGALSGVFDNARDVLLGEQRSTNRWLGR